MRVTDIATDIAADQDSVVFELITLKAGDDEFAYRFAGEDDNYLVTRDDIDFVFKIAKSSYDSVMESALLPEPEEAPPPSADAAESPNSVDTETDEKSTND